jgi:hypothetical protein
MDAHTQIQEKLLTLQTAILEANPRMPSLLQEIHRSLKNDPAVVTLLSEEELSILIHGLKTHTTTTIVTAKPTAAAKRSLSKVSSADLGF